MNLERSRWQTQEDIMHRNKLSYDETVFFVSVMRFLFPEDLSSEFILTLLQLALCRVTAVKSLLVHLHLVPKPCKAVGALQMTLY